MGEGKKKAIIIGIDKYKDKELTNLQYAKNDAEMIKSVLLDKDIGDFQKEDVILITSTEDPEHDITNAEVEENIEAILTEAKSEDLVLIYYAGHGKLDKYFDLYLATENTNINKLISTSIRIKNIRRMIKNSECEKVVFIIDSCYSGAEEQIARNPEIIPDSLKDVSKDTVIISATQAIENAIERKDIEGGIFTHTLVTGLKEDKMDYDQDGYISVDEMFKYVKAKVEAETKGEQKPMMFPDEKESPIGKIIIAKSKQGMQRQRDKIEERFKNFKEFLEDKNLELAFMSLNFILESKPSDTIREQAEEKFNELMNELRNKLVDYKATKEEDVIPGKIENVLAELLTKKHSELNSDQKERIKIFARGMSGGNIGLFIDRWKRLDEQEDRLIVHEKKKDKKSKAQEETLNLKPGTTLPGATRRNQRTKEEKEAEMYGSGRGLSNENRVKEVKKEALIRTQVLIVCEKNDEQYLERFRKNLGYFEQRKGLKVCCDATIKPGQKMKEEIEINLASAKVAVLLVSPDFLDSELITKRELPPLLEAAKKEGLTILWVAVRASMVKQTEIYEYKSAYDPKKPLADLSKARQDKAIVEICEKILEFFEPVNKKPVNKQ